MIVLKNEDETIRMYPSLVHKIANLETGRQENLEQSHINRSR